MPTGGKGADPMLGTVIEARYKVTAAIGAGGMGSVYRATQLNVDRDVAIKVLAHGFSENEDLVRRFENEARIISQLRHPNTLKLIDFGRMEDGRLFIVTEFLSGVSLAKELKQSGRLGVLRTLRLLQEICASLVEAHGKGIIHRDLKPANIFLESVGDEEIVKVLDFGIAKLSEQPAVTRTGTLFGTPAYMPPEQARGTGVDARTDLYSLGVIAYECLCGRTPFVSDNVTALLLNHIMDPPPPLGSFIEPHIVPRPVEDLVMALLAKDPASRPASAAVLRRALEDLERERGFEPGASRPDDEKPTASNVELPEGVPVTRSAAETSVPPTAPPALLSSIATPLEPRDSANAGPRTLWIAAFAAAVGLSIPGAIVFSNSASVDVQSAEQIPGSGASAAQAAAVESARETTAAAPARAVEERTVTASSSAARVPAPPTSRRPATTPPIAPRDPAKPPPPAAKAPREPAVPPSTASPPPSPRPADRATTVKPRVAPPPGFVDVP